MRSRARVVFSAALCVVLGFVPDGLRAEGEEPTGAYRVSVDLGDAIRLLGTEDAFEREPAEELLLVLDEQAVPALATALEKENAQVRRGVVDVLVSIEGEGVTELLVERAKGDPSVDVRAAAISALISRVDPGADAIVRDALASEDPRLYRSAFDGCARFCTSPEELDRIVAFAFSEPASLFASGPRGVIARAANDPAKRDDVLAALERGATPKLADPAVEPRIRAGLLFFDVGDPRAVDGLNAVFEGDAPLVLRLQAIVSLGAVGDEATVAKIAAARSGLPRSLAPGVCKALGQLARRGMEDAVAEARRADCPGVG